MRRIRLSKADLFSAFLCTLAIIPCIGVYHRLPDRIATNFDIIGQPQQYASKAFAVFAIPLIMTVIQLILCMITNLFHKTDTRDTLNKAIRFLTPTIYYVVQFAIVLYALEKITNMLTVICTFMGVLLVVAGNFMPKIRRNMFLGIRTPHTLANQEVWDKTHRFSGVLFTICGLVMIPFSLVNNYIAIIIIYAHIIIIPIIYSEMTYRRAKQEVHE